MRYNVRYERLVIGWSVGEVVVELTEADFARIGEEELDVLEVVRDRADTLLMQGAVEFAPDPESLEHPESARLIDIEEIG